MVSPRISVCIPSYNRAKYLKQVLDSVLCQGNYLYEIVICEDSSPEREEIRAVASEYKAIYGDKIVYVENEKNLGFDANLRQLLRMATGDYCMFLGNDDLLCKDALYHVIGVIARSKNIGVIIRAYGWFEGDPENIVGAVRYYKEDKVFRAGLDALTFAFRRSCVLAGLTLKREPALELETTEFDGSLFYQLHLVGRITLKYDCAYCNEMIAICRADEKPEFGHAAAEKGQYTPGEYTINARLNMMKGILKIAKSIGGVQPGATDKILADVATYSFPWLAYHSDKSFAVFNKYYKELGKLGLGRYPIYHIYYLLILLLGASFINKLIFWLRKLLGSTPQIRFR